VVFAICSVCVVCDCVGVCACGELFCVYDFGLCVCGCVKFCRVCVWCFYEVCV